jgi:ankyrin repeat protein
MSAKAPAKPSSFPFTTATTAPAAAASPSYEKSGEGMRDAIKAGDVAGAVALLAAGVSATFVDAQGMSLLHVAALFNAGDIALALMDAGASADARNAQGETALEVAPPSLAHRMRARAEALAAAPKAGAA